MKRFVIAAIFAGLAVSATAAPRDRRIPPPATESGKPVSCINLSQIRSTRVHGDSTIDFYLNGGKVYRNTLPYSCPTLGFEERFLYVTSISQICSVDFITVLQQPFLQRGPSCGLGMFQPVTLTKATPIPSSGR